MVEAEDVEDGGVEVVDGRDVLDRLIPEKVGGAVRERSLDVSAGEKARETGRVVVAAGCAPLESRHAAELGAPHDERLLEQTTLPEVLDEGCHRLVQDRTVDVVLILGSDGRLFSERRIAQGERQELESLLQYMERAPVSLQRLSYLDDGQVLYRGNFHPGIGRDYQLVSGLEFLAMLVPHIALRYECRIHCYGAISTTIRRQLGWIEKEETPQAPKDVTIIEEEESEFAKVRRKNWARLIAKVWLGDPSLCPSCGKEVRVVSALTSPHQDDVILRRELRLSGKELELFLERKEASGGI